MQIYVNRNNQQLGPFTEAEIKAQLASGAISLQDHAWWQGQATWVPLSQTPYGRTVPTSPVPVPGSQPNVERNSNYALWSLICGVCSLTLVCGILFVPTIVLGHLALSEIKKNPLIRGRIMAFAGLIIGYLMGAFVFISALVIFVMLALGSQVKSTFKTESTVLSTSSKDDSDNTVSATPSDQSTNAAPASDSSTNSTPTVTP